MHIKALGAALVVLVLAVAGCSNTEGSGYPGTKQTVGGLGGAALGGVLGAALTSGKSSSTRAFAAAAGAVVGLLAGSEVGRSLDDNDKRNAAAAQEKAATAPLGQTIAWNNPNSGNSGAYTPTRDGYASDGRYCREFEETIVIGGKTERGTGVACRNPDGTWKIIS